MQFNSIEYFVFLAIVVVAFWALPQARRPWLLLAASYVFYAWWDWRLCGLLAFTTVTTWGGGLLMAQQPARGARRLLLAYSLVLSLGVLVAFKVYGFFVASLATTGSDAILLDPAANLLMPVGLSFYTFQAVSYVVDVYRGEAEPERSLRDYALFVSFFPHLLAGPIVRAKRLLPELKRSPRRLDPVARNEGLDLLVTGLFKKVALGDVLSGTALTLFAGTEDQGTVMTVVLLLCGLMGAYFDIAGYIDMARGSAKLVGVYLQPNFAQPLTRAVNLTDFWRRWQITVMAWFRDYVYRPVRGSSRTLGREVVAVAATFAAVGLWHGGTSLGWVTWTVATVAILVAERVRRERKVARHQADRRAARVAARAQAARTGTAPAKLPRTEAAAPSFFRQLRQRVYVWATVLFTLTWLTGSDGDLGRGVRLLGDVLVPTWAPLDVDALVFCAYGLFALWVLDARERRVQALEGKPDPVTNRRALAYGLMVGGVLLFSGQAATPFLYFRF